VTDSSRDLSPLAGRAILIVEDEYFVMKRLTRALEDAGATVVGPVASVSAALALTLDGTPLDAAVLDVNLLGEMVFPVADALAARGVPYAFATGYDPDVIPARHAGIPLLRKPVDPAAIVAALFTAG
jgi:DNA-binding response OmpR family regulator